MDSDNVLPNTEPRSHQNLSATLSSDKCHVGFVSHGIHFKGLSLDANG
jgi:hypothetical protein